MTKNSYVFMDDPIFEIVDWEEPYELDGVLWMTPIYAKDLEGRDGD